MNIKSLLLGSAAALVAVTGARAAMQSLSPNRNPSNTFKFATLMVRASSTFQEPKPV